MPRTAGESTSTLERWRLLRPSPISVAFCTSMRPMVLPVCVTLIFLPEAAAFFEAAAFLAAGFLAASVIMQSPSHQPCGPALHSRDDHDGQPPCGGFPWLRTQREQLSPCCKG